MIISNIPGVIISSIPRRFRSRKKSRKVYVGKDNVNEVLVHLHPDEELRQVLQVKLDGVATQYDECYLDDKIRNDPEAMDCYKAMQTMYPNADLKPKCIKRMTKKVLLILLPLLAGIILYACFYKRARPSVPKQNEHGVYFKMLSTLMDSAQVQYHCKIVLDQTEIGNIICSGTLDPEVPLESFLKLFTELHGLEFYSDTANVIHIRRAQTEDSIDK